MVMPPLLNELIIHNLCTFFYHYYHLLYFVQILRRAEVWANAKNWKSNSRQSFGNRQPHSIVQKFMVGLQSEDIVETAMTARFGELNHCVITCSFSHDTDFTKSFSNISGLEEKLRELLNVLKRNRYPSVFTSIHHGLMHYFGPPGTTNYFGPYRWTFLKFKIVQNLNLKRL